jgi:hypothetical protein
VLRRSRPTVEVERVKTLYAAGASVGKIARTLGISYMRTRVALIRCGALERGKTSDT